jgi:hypothetical protein
MVSVVVVKGIVAGLVANTKHWPLTRYLQDSREYSQKSAWRVLALYFGKFGKSSQNCLANVGKSSKSSQNCWQIMASLVCLPTT